MLPDPSPYGASRSTLVSVLTLERLRFRGMVKGYFPRSGQTGDHRNFGLRHLSRKSIKFFLCTISRVTWQILKEYGSRDKPALDFFCLLFSIFQLSNLARAAPPLPSDNFCSIQPGQPILFFHVCAETSRPPSSHAMASTPYARRVYLGSKLRQRKMPPAQQSRPESGRKKKDTKKK